MKVKYIRYKNSLTKVEERVMFPFLIKVNDDYMLRIFPLKDIYIPMTLFKEGS